MPFSCSVPNCNGNYKTGPKVKVFSFPKDENLRSKWISAIKCKDFIPTANSKVCERHFSDDDIIKEVSEYNENGQLIKVGLKIGRLRTGAIPTIFPNCPDYMSSATFTREDPEERKKRIEFENLSKAIEDSVKEKVEYEKTYSFQTIEELQNKLHLVDYNENWNTCYKRDKFMFLFIELLPAPEVKYSVMLDKDLKLTAFGKKIPTSKIGNFTLPVAVNNCHSLSEILNAFNSLSNSFNSSDNSNFVILLRDLLESYVKENNEDAFFNFFYEQINLKTMAKPNYTTEMLVFSTLFHTLSPPAYKFIRQSKKMILPHKSTIQRLCFNSDLNPYSEQNDANFLYYIKQKVSHLKPTDFNVMLDIDEIHLKEFLDYKGGNIAGMSYDYTKLASSAQVFMINSLQSPYKDVAHVLPVKTITYVELHNFIKKIIVHLEKIGFNVFCAITDNNEINRKSMSQFVQPPKLQFVYPHPVNKQKPLFFIIDPVHLFKCIRNNWINQKNGQCMYFPSFENVTDIKEFHTASFDSLNLLYESETNKLLKYGYNLTFKSLHPSSLERQNVKLVLKFFNEFIINALLEIGEKKQIPHYKDTADYIQIHLNWWKIMNVKSKNVGIRRNDPLKTPLTFSDDDNKLKFLYNYLDWLDAWENMKCTSGALTKQTHSALKLTANGIIEIASYCKNELNLDYILPGKFQTDDLELRFSLYRQLSGSNYHISIRQLFESENKLRIRANMKLGILGKKNQNVQLSEIILNDTLEDLSENMRSESSFEINIDENEIAEAEEYMPVLVYISGYCVFSVFKKYKCESCKEELTVDKEFDLTEIHDFILKFDRGKLFFPSPAVVNVILYSYLILNKILNEKEMEFLKCSNQREVAFTTIENYITNRNLFQLESFCEFHHNPRDI